jgi:hypothetical protein
VIVRVPSKKVVEGIQDQLEGLVSAGGTAAYPLPSFYADNWPVKEQSSLGEVKLMRMHCQRIGYGPEGYANRPHSARRLGGH